MNTKTSIVLAVVALGLAAFIYFFERHQPTTDDLRDRGDRVLPGFDRDRVDRVVLGEGDDRVELARAEADEADAGAPGSVGDWRIVHPRELPADPEEVDSLLSAVDWLEKRRTVTREPGAELSKYGLAEPSASIMLRLRGRDVKLSVGGEAPGQGRYLALSTNDEEIYVVDNEFMEQISKQVSDLRDKRLTAARASNVEAVRITGRFHVVKQDGRWSLVTPIAMRADRSRVEDVVRDLERLRAVRFVADDVAEGDLERYGLSSPRREVTLRIAGESSAVTLRFGGECEGHADEVYATALGSGTVACVDGEILGELDVNPDRLRDLRPHTFEADDLDRVELVRGDRRVVVRKVDGAWRLGAPAEGGDDEGRPADEDAVESFVNALREARAEDVSSDLEAAGLAGDGSDDEVVVTLTPGGRGDPEVLRFSISEDAVHLRRGDEGVALVLPADLAEGLRVDELRFRDRHVLNATSNDADEIEVTVGGTRQVLRKQGTRWQMVEPLEFAADDVFVRAVVRSIARLQVERFVASAPAAEHGLAQPRIRLRIRFTARGDDEGDAGGGESVEHVLLIGAETEGGAFARLEGDDETVFVVAQPIVARLLEPMVDRDLFAVEEDEVTGLTIALEGRPEVTLERHDGGWRGPDGAAPEGAVDRLLARLAVARASEVVGLGAAPAEAGLDRPRARLTLRLAAGDDGEEPLERVMVLGAEYGEEGSRRVYARRGDVDATFGMPLRAVRPILEWGTSSGSAGGDAGASGDASTGG